jgi:cellulose biosynthesis protein BcsQ
MVLNYNPDYCLNERDVEGKLVIQYLLPQLGYSPDSWHQEVVFGKIRLDFLVFAAQILPFVISASSPLSLVIEAKHPKQNLNKHTFKFGNYLRSLRICHGVLTNGKELRIYRLEGDQIILKFDCLATEIDANLETIRSLIGKDSLSSIIQSPSEVLKPSESLSLSTSTKTKEAMKIIAVYHNKGGVGKTTTIVNLAAALAKKGKRILIVDLDSQANTTYAVGLAKFLNEEEDTLRGKNIRQLINSSQSQYLIKNIVRKTSFTQFTIDAIPAHIELMEDETRLLGIVAAKKRLYDKLQAVKEEYDVVLIDTPPSLGLYAKIALLTAQYLIIPSDLKPFANQGLNNVRKFIDEINEDKAALELNPLEILGILRSKISTFAQFVKYTLPKRTAIVENDYGFTVMDTIIFEREDIAKSLENCVPDGNDFRPEPQSILDYRPNSDSAKEFENLASEVLKKIGLAV